MQPPQSHMPAAMPRRRQSSVLRADFQLAEPPLTSLGRSNRTAARRGSGFFVDAPRLPSGQGKRRREDLGPDSSRGLSESAVGPLAAGLGGAGAHRCDGAARRPSRRAARSAGGPPAPAQLNDSEGVPDAAALPRSGDSDGRAARPRAPSESEPCPSAPAGLGGTRGEGSRAAAISVASLVGSEFMNLDDDSDVNDCGPAGPGHARGEGGGRGWAAAVSVASLVGSE